jgi:hypothetical protein
MRESAKEYIAWRRCAQVDLEMSHEGRCAQSFSCTLLNNPSKAAYSRKVQRERLGVLDAASDIEPQNLISRTSLQMCLHSLKLQQRSFKYAQQSENSVNAIIIIILNQYTNIQRLHTTYTVIPPRSQLSFSGPRPIPLPELKQFPIIIPLG